MPNIDINIKCGNSLISHIDTNTTLENFTANLQNRLIAANKKQDLFLNQSLNSEIKDIEKKAQSKFQEMRKNVESYKNEGNKQVAKAYKDTYENAYQYLCELFKRNCNEYINFHQVLKDFFHKYGYINLAQLEPETKFYIESYAEFFDFHKSVDFERKTQREIPQKELENLLKLMQIYEDFNQKATFEWRFAFPEVLDSNGDFIGFDLIIGNPPYMQVPKGIFDTKLYPYSEDKDKGKQNLYKVFIELGYNLGHTNSIISLITQSSIMCDLSAQYTRELLLKSTQMHYFVEFKKNQKIFTNVIQGVCIIEFQKAKPTKTHSFQIAINNAESQMDKIQFESITQQQILDFFPLYEIPLIKKGEMPIVAKVKTGKILLKDMLDSSLQGNINTIHLKKIQSNKRTNISIYKGAHCHRWYLDKGFYGLDNELTHKIITKNKNQFIITTQNITGTADKIRIYANFTESKRRKISGWASELKASKLAF